MEPSQWGQDWVREGTEAGAGEEDAERESGHCWRRQEGRVWGLQILMANATYDDPGCDRELRQRTPTQPGEMGDRLSEKDWPVAPSAGSEPSLFCPYLGKLSVAEKRKRKKILRLPLGLNSSSIHQSLYRSTYPVP